MTPGDIVRCIDARYSEGRLVEGKLYVVRMVLEKSATYARSYYSKVNPSDFSIMVWGSSAPGDPNHSEGAWNNRRFVPVNRKDMEILAKVADKIMGGVK